MPVSYKNHGPVPVAVAVVLGGFNQPFDLGLSQVLPCPHVLVGRPFGGNCSIYGSWRDQPETRLGHVFRAPGIDDCSYNGLCLESCSSQSATCAAPCRRPIWRILGISLASAPGGERMDQRIESFLADVLALEGEDESAIHEGVRVALADCEQIFKAQEVNRRMKDEAAHACHVLCRARVVEEMQRRKGTASAEHIEVCVECYRRATLPRQGRLAQPLDWLVASDQPIALKKADGLAWRIQHPCGLAQGKATNVISGRSEMASDVA